MQRRVRRPSALAALLHLSIPCADAQTTCVLDLVRGSGCSSVVSGHHAAAARAMDPCREWDAVHGVGVDPPPLHPHCTASLPLTLLQLHADSGDRARPKLDLELHQRIAGASRSHAWHDRERVAASCSPTSPLRIYYYSLFNVAPIFGIFFINSYKNRSHTSIFVLFQGPRGGNLKSAVHERKKKDSTPAEELVFLAFPYPAKWSSE